MYEAEPVEPTRLSKEGAEKLKRYANGSKVTIIHANVLKPEIPAMIQDESDDLKFKHEEHLKEITPGKPNAFEGEVIDVIEAETRFAVIDTGKYLVLEHAPKRVQKGLHFYAKGTMKEIPVEKLEGMIIPKQELQADDF